MQLNLNTEHIGGQRQKQLIYCQREQSPNMLVNNRKLAMYT